jgi:formylmethanofuran dehydrogenase subunit E
MKTLDEILKQSAALHCHLCPRQVLGARMGLLAGALLGLDLPQSEKRLLVIAETDGCAVDGISAATNCTVGHRTLRVEDYGKVAATFVDSKTGKAIRIVPRASARETARAFAPDARSKWDAYLLGYQRMPNDELFEVQHVELLDPIERIVSHAGKKTTCTRCGEEIINEREIRENGTTLCVTCAGGGYYRSKSTKELKG